MKRYLKNKKNQWKILKILRLRNSIEQYQKSMIEENIIQEFRFKEIDEQRNYFIEEIKQNELISKKHKKICRILNYIRHLLILAFTGTGCVSVSAFNFLTGMPIGSASSATAIKIFVITAGIKKYKSII